MERLFNFFRDILGITKYRKKIQDDFDEIIDLIINNKLVVANNKIEKFKNGKIKFYLMGLVTGKVYKSKGLKTIKFNKIDKSPSYINNDGELILFN